jgi:Xaa-Pro aminopeptidase
MGFNERRGRVVEQLPDDVPAMLVTNLVNLRYLTGFSGSNGQLLLTADSLFFTDGRYIEQSASQVPDLPREIYSGTTKFTDVLGKALADRGVTKIAVEASTMTLATSDRLRGELSGIELVGTTDIVEKVRRRKEPSEIDAVRAAQQVAEEALTSTLKGFKGGTERELGMQIEWAVRTGGAEAMSFDTIVAGDGHAALPHAEPRDVPVDLERLLLIDMGAKVDGYCSDMTRTFLGPRAPDEMRKVHAIVADAVEAGLAAVKPGAKCSDVDKACRDLIADAGYGDRFIHSTGHGVGLEIHEGPSLNMTSDDELEPGMIVTIEPGIYIAGVGGVRIEDFVVVTEDGYENLTSLPRGPEFPS